jgi:hypothetical protein
METRDHAAPLMGHAAPLMDHAQFVEALGTPPPQASNDATAPAGSAAKAKPRPVAFPAAARTSDTRTADEPRRHGPQFMMPDVNPDLIVEAAQSPATRRVLLVAGFVLMMSIGAAAAALVFHDRVAQIISGWPIAGR